MVSNIYVETEVSEKTSPKIGDGRSAMVKIQRNVWRRPMSNVRNFSSYARMEVLFTARKLYFGELCFSMGVGGIMLILEPDSTTKCVLEYLSMT